MNPRSKLDAFLDELGPGMSLEVRYSDHGCRYTMGGESFNVIDDPGWEIANHLYARLCGDQSLRQRYVANGHSFVERISERPSYSVLQSPRKLSGAANIVYLTR